MTGYADVSEKKMPSLFEVIRRTNSENREEILKKYITENTMAHRWPQNAVLELSPICNLACKMCYVRKTPMETEKFGGIRSLAEWKDIVDKCIEIGVVCFTLTGGECLLYPDFIELYNYIYDRSSQITIMTNAALITSEHIELFKKKKPIKMPITVYGASRETYERLCGNPGAYDQVMNALSALRENNIPFYIQMTITKDNVDDLSDVIRLSRKLGVRFAHMDSLLSFGNADEALRDEMSAKHEKVIETLKNEMPLSEKDSEQVQKEKQLLEHRKKQGKPPRPGIHCNAARNTFIINWRGEMQPCTTLDAYKVSILDHDFRETWENMVKWADSLCVLPECYTCEYATKCVTCIAQHYNDTHDFSKPSPRLCWKMKHPEGASQDDADEEIPECPDGF